MDIKETLKHAWKRLMHLNILRTDSKQNKGRSESQNVNIDMSHNNSRDDYQNTKPGEHIRTRQRQRSRGPRTM